MVEALLEGRGWHTHCVCVYRRELMLNISMFMLQQSHSLCSVIRDILICTFRCCLCRVYVSIFIFPHPFNPVRNAFLSAGAFFIRFAPSFCPRLDSSTTGLGATAHSHSQKTFCSYGARGIPCVGAFNVGSLYEMRIFYSARAFFSPFEWSIEWGSIFFGGGWFDVIYNMKKKNLFSYTLFSMLWTIQTGMNKKKIKKEFCYRVCQDSSLSLTLNCSWGLWLHWVTAIVRDLMGSKLVSVTESPSTVQI